MSPRRPDEEIERRIPIFVSDDRGRPTVGGGWKFSAPGEGGRTILDTDDWRRRIIVDLRAQGLNMDSPEAPQGPLSTADLGEIMEGPEIGPAPPRRASGVSSDVSIEISGWLEYDTGE